MEHLGGTVSANLNPQLLPGLRCSGKDLECSLYPAPSLAQGIRGLPFTQMLSHASWRCLRRGMRVCGLQILAHQPGLAVQQGPELSAVSQWDEAAASPSARPVRACLGCLASGWSPGSGWVLPPRLLAGIPGGQTEAWP